MKIIQLDFFIISFISYSRQDFVEDLRKHPVDAASGPRLARWLCDAHNRVNEKLGKEQFDCAKVRIMI